MTALMYIGGLGSGMDYDRGRLAQFFWRSGTGIANTRRGSAPTPRIFAGVRQANVTSRHGVAIFIYLLLITYPNASSEEINAGF